MPDKLSRMMSFFKLETQKYSLIVMLNALSCVQFVSSTGFKFILLLIVATCVHSYWLLLVLMTMFHSLLKERSAYNMLWFWSTLVKICNG